MQFDIPIVLFTFKRKKVTLILDQIKKINPRKLYILSDGPRNESEKREVLECREVIDKKIHEEFHNTEVVKRYSNENLGVYQNIGCGAKWIFSKESEAIFLEDDNLPEITFFDFCREMLIKYRHNKDVVWICGTNYLEKYNSPYSYVFTQHMLPCGWASWGEKFNDIYDGNLIKYDEKEYSNYRNRYISEALFKQFNHAISLEKKRILDGKKPISWDFQMDFSLKYNNVYGICPSYNQIRNIGADEDAIHGGSNIKKGLASKFCEKKTYPLTFPLVDPPRCSIDKEFEKQTGKIMLQPLNLRIRGVVFGAIRKICGVPYDMKFKEYIKNWRLFR